MSEQSQVERADDLSEQSRVEPVDDFLNFLRRMSRGALLLAAVCEETAGAGGEVEGGLHDNQTMWFVGEV